MNDFFKLPVTLMEAMSENDMMLVVGGDKVVVEYTVVNEGNGCNVEGALNKGTRLRLLSRIPFWARVVKRIAYTVIPQQLLL